MDDQLNQSTEQTTGQMADQTAVPPAGQTPPPPNYLIWAILATILCCLPFGIVSIVYAAQVNSKWQSGDAQGAMSASKNAKTWAWVSFFSALGILVFYLILLALGVGTAFFSGIFD